MLAMGMKSGAPDAWRVRVVATSAPRGEGVADLLAAIDGHWAALAASGEIAARRNQINERRILRAAEEILREQFARRRDGRVSQLVAQLNARSQSPHGAAVRLLDDIRIGGEE